MPPELWTLQSPAGVRAEILGYGAVLRSLRVPDTDGETADVVLGLPTATEYAGPHPYFGATVGRYANRIAHGRFTLDGTAHRVPVNDRGHALHGGPEGFHRRVWRARPRSAAGSEALELTLHSPDGDMGFPGALDVTLVYSLDEHGTLALDYTARCDRPTVVNLTHHSYFNLLGAGEGDVLGHTLALDAAAYLPVTPEGIPNGHLAATAGTPFDFARPRAIGEHIDEPDPQLVSAGGYDHCYVLPPARPDGAPRRAARLAAPGGGRRMEVWTTEPGIQLYTGNTLDGSLPGGCAKPYGRHGGVCLETQSFPDSPNRPEYPSTVLPAGREFRSRTEYRFPHLATAPGQARGSGRAEPSAGL